MYAVAFYGPGSTIRYVKGIGDRDLPNRWTVKPFPASRSTHET